VSSPQDIVRRARGLFGNRLRGLFAFGSRVAGHPGPASDLDLGVWIEGPMRRADTWLPWIREFETEDPVLDPTFLGSHTLDDPPSWLLEAVAGGVEVWLDDDGRLAARLATIGDSVRSGAWQRRTFMGLPYYRRAAS
jgi:predicted nucleotidyltransferase